MFFFFAIYFYRDFAKNKLNKSSKQIKELESIIVSLEQNDLTFCQTPDDKRDVNNNRKRGNVIQPRVQHGTHRASAELQAPASSLFLKNLCKYKNHSGSNDHLLAQESLRSQSASVDQINAFRAADDPKGDLYRSKVATTIGRGSHDNVRFSMDNVSLNTYASSFSAYNSIQNTIQHSLQNSLQSGLQNCIPDSFQDCTSGSTFSDSPIGRVSRKAHSRPQSRTNSRMLAPSAASSLHLAASRSMNETASIDDQQSNDSKMPKKEGEPFNNLSATVV